jgi:hypothetical protein
LYRITIQQRLPLFWPEWARGFEPDKPPLEAIADSCTGRG